MLLIIFFVNHINNNEKSINLFKHIKKLRVIKKKLVYFE